jgi:hypothetical protein
MKRASKPKQVLPICMQEHDPVPHNFVPWDDPRFSVCSYGCGTAIGPPGTWGAPVETIDAAPQLLFGDETPPANPASKLVKRAMRERKHATHDAALNALLGVVSNEEAQP